MSDDKLFTLRTNLTNEKYAYYNSGRLPDGRQALMGNYGIQLLLVLFAADGTFLEEQTRPLADGPKSGEITEADKAELIARRLRWQQELGWQEGPITVRRFQLLYQRVRIADYPDWGVAITYDPYSLLPREREQLRAMLEEWKASGNFVFWWGNGFHLDKEGNVLST